MLRTIGTLAGLALVASLGTGAQAAVLTQRVLNAPGFEMTATREIPPARVNGMADLGRVSYAQPMHIVVSLPMRNKSIVDVILRRQNTPGDPMFGHLLTPNETRAIFSPSGASVNAVANYLAANGFSNIHATIDNQMVTADAPAGAVSRAFATEIHAFAGPAGRAFANVKPALIPHSLHGMVLAVLGLNSFSLHEHLRHTPAAAHRAAVARRVALAAAARRAAAAGRITTDTSTPEPCNGITLPGGTCVGNEYDAQQFRTAYDIPATATTCPKGTAPGCPHLQDTGATTPIAIFTEGDMTSVLSDLKLYEAANNLQPITPIIIHAGIPSSDTSGADEFDLDTQVSTGLAQIVKKLYLYNITSLTDSDAAVGFARFQTDDIAKAGSASFGGCEVLASTDGTMSTDDETFARAAVQGQTVFNSSGDNGFTCALLISSGVPGTGLPMQSYPTTSPYVVSVGGDTLVASSTPGAPPVYMLGWQGSGGGISYLESSPFWQQGVVNVVCSQPASVGEVDTGKCVPDISMDADNELSPAVIYVGGSTEGVGGTSLASPRALAAWAIIENRHCQQLGFAAPLLYQMYKNNTSYNSTTGIYTAPTAVPPADQLIGGLIDETTGTNGAFVATSGYDNVTGLGSIDVPLTNTDIPSTYPQ
jgi:pseudomonalisin/xanthomonalisin